MVQKLQKTLGVKFVSTVKVVSESDLEAAVNDGNYSVAFYPFKAKSSFAGEIIEGFDKNNMPLKYRFASQTATKYRTSGKMQAAYFYCGNYCRFD